MIPSAVAALADLIWPHWDQLDEEDKEEKMALDDILAAAWRVYNAGYRQCSQERL